MPNLDKILLGQFGAAHGIRGEVRLIAYAEDPLGIRGYGPLALDDGRTVELAGVRVQGDHFIARVKGIADRNAAEALTNHKFFIDRGALPALDEDEDFYQADLIGLAVETIDGAAAGTVIAVHNFGAGDLLEIEPPGGGRTEFLSFTKAIVPTVDIKAGRLVIVPPDEIDGGAPKDGEEG